MNLQVARDDGRVCGREKSDGSVWRDSMSCASPAVGSRGFGNIASQEKMPFKCPVTALWGNSTISQTTDSYSQFWACWGQSWEAWQVLEAASLSETSRTRSGSLEGCPCQYNGEGKMTWLCGPILVSRAVTSGTCSRPLLFFLFIALWGNKCPNNNFELGGPCL